MIGKVVSVAALIGSVLIIVLGFVFHHQSWLIGFGIILVPTALYGMLDFFVADEKSAAKHFRHHPPKTR